MEKLNVIPIDTIKTFVSKYKPKPWQMIIHSNNSFFDKFYINIDNTYIIIKKDGIGISNIDLTDYYTKKDIEELYNFIKSEYPRIVNEFLENVKMYLEICR